VWVETEISYVTSTSWKDQSSCFGGHSSKHSVQL